MERTAAWARAVDFRLSDVPELDITAFRRQPIAKTAGDPERADAPMFRRRTIRLDAAFAPITWVRPSEGDQDIVQIETSSVVAWEQPIDALAVVKGGSVRGTILHKLMEELITGRAASISRSRAERGRASSSGNLCPLRLHPG